MDIFVYFISSLILFIAILIEKYKLCSLVCLILMIRLAFLLANFYEKIEMEERRKMR